MAKQFWTESCGDCSNLRWGTFSIGQKFEVDPDGEHPGCFDGEKIIELDRGYISACQLSPEEALEWWFPDKPPISIYTGVCSRYDGPRPSREEIEKEIRQSNPNR